MIMLGKEYYFTEAMFKEFEIEHTMVYTSVGDVLYLEPSSLYQSVSTSSGRSASIRSASRSSDWSHTGGPQAVLRHLMDAKTYLELGEDRDLFFVVDPSIITKQLPEAAIRVLLTTMPAPAPPVRFGWNDTVDKSNAIMEYDESLCALTVHFLPSSEASEDVIKKAIGRVKKVSREGERNKENER